MEPIDVLEKVMSWLRDQDWEYTYDEENYRILLSLESARTGNLANIQVRAYKDGWYRVLAIWPDAIETDGATFTRYVTEVSDRDSFYGRLKYDQEKQTVYFTCEVNVNNISELTDDILRDTIFETAIILTDKYGADIEQMSKA